MSWKDDVWRVKSVGTGKKRLHEALITVAEEDVDLLSYKGQMLWNALAREEERTIKKRKMKK